MTLVEVMVALVLLSLLSIGVVTSFRLGERAYHQVTTVVSVDQDVVSTQRFLRQIIESTYPFRQPEGSRTTAFGLEGTATALTVTAPMPLNNGSRGNYRYELLVRPDVRGLNTLLVRWTLDRNGTLVTSSLNSAGEVHEEILLEGIESLEWSYLGAGSSGNIASTDVRSWTSSWSGNRAPPALVRLRVTFPAGDRRRWPELMIDPRLTDDASCQFDVVAQACRET